MFTYGNVSGNFPIKLLVTVSKTVDEKTDIKLY
jgi:hypothetical protein